MVDVCPEFDVTGTSPDSPFGIWDSSTDPTISATTLCTFGVHISRPKQPIFSASPSEHRTPLALPDFSKEDLSGPEMTWPRNDSVLFGACPASDLR